MLSPHFRRSEFACRCGCGFDTVDTELLEVLERLRNHFMRPLLLTPRGGGARCADYNAQVRGADRSQHMLGKAADFVVVSIPASEVQSILRQWYPDRYGLGRARTYTHFDVRGRKSDWIYG